MFLDALNVRITETFVGNQIYNYACGVRVLSTNVLLCSNVLTGRPYTNAVRVVSFRITCVLVTEINVEMKKCGRSARAFFSFLPHFIVSMQIEFYSQLDGFLNELQYSAWSHSILSNSIVFSTILLNRICINRYYILPQRGTLSLAKFLSISVLGFD